MLEGQHSYFFVMSYFHAQHNQKIRVKIHRDNKVAYLYTEE